MREKDIGIVLMGYRELPVASWLLTILPMGVHTTGRAVSRILGPGPIGIRVHHGRKRRCDRRRGREGSAAPRYIHLRRVSKL